MATKVIKFCDGNTTYLPVTDSSLVQISSNNETISVKDAILENEEVTAAVFNDLNDRVETLENSGFITSIPVTANNPTINISANGAGGNVTIATINGINLNLSYSHGLPDVNVVSELHFDAIGTGLSGDSTIITGSSYIPVMSGISVFKDANGHVTRLDVATTGLKHDITTSSDVINNMKYGVLASSVPEINEGWLQSATGRSTALASSSYVSVAGGTFYTPSVVQNAPINNNSEMTEIEDGGEVGEVTNPISEPVRP